MSILLKQNISDFCSGACSIRAVFLYMLIMVSEEISYKSCQVLAHYQY